MRVRILTIINNYGEVRYIVQNTARVPYLLFFTKTVWVSRTSPYGDSPHFFDVYADALTEAHHVLQNSNSRNQRIITQTNVEEITV